MSRSRLLSSLVTLGAVLALVGCGAEGNETEPRTNQDGQGLYERHLTLENGRSITCVVYDDDTYEQGGVSCDWTPTSERTGY